MEQHVRIQKAIIRDLLSMEKAITHLLYDSKTGVYSPDGWLAHRAGATDRQLEDAVFLWGHLRNKVRDHYGMTNYQAFHLCHHIQRAVTHIAVPGKAAIAAAIDAVENFEWEKYKEARPFHAVL